MLTSSPSMVANADSDAASTTSQEVDELEQLGQDQDEDKEGKVFLVCPSTETNGHVAQRKLQFQKISRSILWQTLATRTTQLLLSVTLVSACAVRREHD